MKTVIKREDVAGRAQQFLPGSARSMVASFHNVPVAPRVLPQHTMARLGEVIAREVRMFKRGGDDLIDVVLTPDIKTHISLQLQWRDGQVAVQARCDCGDHQGLVALWPQLQAQLANYEVRLSDLTGRPSTGFTEFFRNPNIVPHQNHASQPEQPAGITNGLPPTPPAPNHSAAATSSGRLKRLFTAWL